MMFVVEEERVQRLHWWMDTYVILEGIWLPSFVFAHSLLFLCPSLFYSVCLTLFL